MTVFKVARNNFDCFIFSLIADANFIQAAAVDRKVKSVWTCIRQCIVPETKIAEFANSVDPDEVAYYEPPHLDLHCLPSGL